MWPFKRSAKPPAETDSALTKTRHKIKISVGKVIRGDKEIAIEITVRNMDDYEQVRMISDPIIIQGDRQYTSTYTREFEDLEEFDTNNIWPGIVVDGYVTLKKPKPGPFQLILEGCNYGYHYWSRNIKEPLFIFTINDSRPVLPKNF